VRTFATIVAVMLALGSSAACGAPARVRTLDDEPDLVGILTIPRGFSPSVKDELQRLRAACMAIDTKVRTQLPDVAPIGGDVTNLGLIYGQCEWLKPAPGPPPGIPELIVGILASPSGGGATLDQTTTVLERERTIASIGDRAVFDRETRTLYVLKNGRLWYLQLVGSARSAAAPQILTVLGRALVETQVSG
jgi:hypothetical protein